MSLTEAHKKNFDTLKKAFSNDDVALLECIDKATGNPVPVICATYEIDKPGHIVFVPFARLFTENPYDQLEPPK